MRGASEPVSRPMYNGPVRRLGLAIVVALLTFGISGLSSLANPEPCTGHGSGASDSNCPPTCVTCGCCAQAVEPVAVAVCATPDTPIADVSDLLLNLPRTTPRDILHVPKIRFA